MRSRARNGRISCENKGGSIVDVISNSEHTVSDYASEFNGWNDKDRSKYITTMVQEFMHYDHVEPEPFHEAIAAFIRRWRENGAFVVADTSTLAGCEISTIKFLSEYYPGCFQGLLLPRNHDGTGSITKAMALDTAVIKLDANNLPIVLVEDTPHHALSFTQTFKDVHVFMPEYDWNKSVAGKDRITRIVRNFGTIDTFIATDKYLQTRGIIMDT